MTDQDLRTRDRLLTLLRASEPTRNLNGTALVDTATQMLAMAERVGWSIEVLGLADAVLDTQRYKALRSAALAYFEATRREPIEGGPPSIAYARTRDDARYKLRADLRAALGNPDDSPCWFPAAEHAATEPQP